MSKGSVAHCPAVYCYTLVISRCGQLIMGRKFACASAIDCYVNLALCQSNCRKIVLNVIVWFLSKLSYLGLFLSMATCFWFMELSCFGNISNSFLRATLAWMIRQHGDMFLLHTDYSIWFSFVHIISFSMQAAGQQVGQVFPQAGAFYMQPLTQVMRLGIM